MPLPPRLTAEEIAALLQRVKSETLAAEEDLEYAQHIIEGAGLTVRSSVLDGSLFSPDTMPGNRAVPASSNNGGPPQPLYKQEAAAAVKARQKFNPLRGVLSAYPIVLSTTGGYSNTDHIVHQNPDGTTNKLSEYKRRMKQRVRQAQTEERGSDRWDLPRIPGGRRRRIKRDADAPSAPPEPPNTGYVIYISQMTTKMRHDNPNRRHDQISAVRRISKMWNTLSEEAKEHYNRLAADAQAQYKARLREYRATGAWQEFTVITRLKNKDVAGAESAFTFDRKTGSQGPWVRIPYEKKNDLEKELESYDQVIFPPRPKEMEEEHLRKTLESKERRKKKIKNYKFKYY
ncbi:hypothetical protein ACHAW6_010622 [Cyclotella cf. meneghiniana]